ncbi:hypothetical protein QNH20_14725 [Neobacillus sp. WH10]|uniref:HAAS signaling domain-containing protein n=1 Tax=Neobacillus sp. WH10 TaxID=3047873 RepID=UPI0024C12241|nr:hypothetical protein [Neobacillus sp. WH10]WHY75400.1 hypothetical protein QNH20_14725 [Neobacillus sp. WH10]
MNLIDLYIQEVTRRLPEKSREDIARELRSTIEDMLPEDYTEQDVTAELKKLGNPAVLASGYLDRPMHLIGPQFFGIYVQLLKWILPLAVTITLITFFVDKMVTFSGDQAVLTVILEAVGEGIVRVLGTGMLVFFWLTAVFAILERVDIKEHMPLGTWFKDWTPDDLKKIPSFPKEKAIPNIEVYGRLFWTVIWVTFYFNASSIVGLYEKGQEGLVFVTPSLNQEVLDAYWPIVVITVCMEIAIAIYKWTVKQWTIKLAIVNTIFQFVSSLLFIKIITDPDLFTSSFSSFLSNLFTQVDKPVTWIVWGAIATFIICAAVDAFQGFKKASIRIVTGNVKKM